MFTFLVYINRINGNTQQLQPLFLQPLKQSFCIFSLAFSNCGEEIIGGGSDGCLYIYDRVVDRRTLRIPVSERNIWSANDFEKKTEEPIRKCFTDKYK